MNSNTGLDQNQAVQWNYDNDHDSDVEFRLYAEIHYTNNIIGEENNSTNTAINNGPQDKPNNSNKIVNSNVLLSSEKTIDQCEQDNTARNLVSNLVTGSKDIAVNNASCSTTVSSVIQPSHVSQNVRNPTDLNKSTTSIKRSSPDNNGLDKSNKSNKKKKRKTNKNNINDIQREESTASDLTNHSNTPVIMHPKNKEIEKQNGNRMINPYNKHVAKPQNSINLLSPEFLNIFFGNKSRSKRKNMLQTSNKKLSKNNKSCIRSTSETVTNKEVKNAISIQNRSNPEVSENQVTQNTVQQLVVTELDQSNVTKNVNEDEIEQQNFSGTASSVIEINSESSEDSIQDYSKYNTIVPTDKKLIGKNSKSKTADVESSTSDSEESIFEVPVPPKPAPPLIEVKDSDSEHQREPESDSDSFASKSSRDMSTDCNKSKISCNSSNTVNLISDTSDDSENEEVDNLILNCTEIQRGASSLDEIKKMSSEASKQGQSTNENTSCTENILSAKENLQNQGNGTINPLRNERVIPNKNISNTLNSKQVSKSCSNAKNIPLEQHFFQPMTDQMKSFYNESWGGENFDMAELKSKMSTDPKKWAILDDDLVQSFSRRKRYFGMVCNRCQKDGHRVSDCPEPYKPRTCHMCGMIGHIETACPHKKCLTCGKKQYMYSKTCDYCESIFCTRCNSRGHLSKACPDLWRRYHNTINSNHVETLKNLRKVMKPSHELFCCNCAKKGHDSFSCKRLRWSQHFPVQSHIINYNGPTYGTRDSNSSKNISDGDHHSFNMSNSHENSFNFDTALESSASNSNHTESPNINHGKNSKNLQIRQSLSTNELTKSNKNVIFIVRSKFFNSETPILQKTVIKLSVPDTNSWSRYDNWKHLLKFLKLFVSKAMADISLEENNRQLIMNVAIDRKFTASLTQLIQQFASRNNYERTHMFLKMERGTNKIITRLSKKVNEMKSILQDPLKLYKEINHLTAECNVDSSRAGKLAVCQKNLLMILYREGFCDDSFTKLNKIYTKVQAKQSCSPKNGIKNSKSTSHFPKLPISINMLLEYLYYFNNIFVPHEPKNLSRYIKKYEQNLEMRDRLRSNPLLFPPEQNSTNTHNEANKISIQSNNYLTPVASTSQTSNTSKPSEVPSLSVNASIVNNIYISKELPCNINSSIPQNNQVCFTNSEGMQQSVTKVQSSFTVNNRNKHLNHLYSKSLTATLPRDKIHYEHMFKNFIKAVKQILAKAQELNAPLMKKHIQILENKLKHEIYVRKQDVCVLKRLVKKESNRQHKDWR